MTMTEDEQQTRSKGLTKAYGKATAALRAAHKPEFEDLYVKAAADLGIDYTPRRTPAMKAEEEFDRLLVDYPELAHKING